VTHKSNILKASGGILQIARRNRITGKPGPYRDMGNAPSLTMSRTPTVSLVLDSRSGTGQTIQSNVDSVAYSIAVQVMDMTMRTVALAMGAQSETITPSTTPVTGEELTEPAAGGMYHLGETVASPYGVRKMSVFTSLAIKAAAHATSTLRAVGDVVSSSGIAYVYTVGGTTAGSAPTFPVAGATVSDGASAILKHLGPIACAGGGVDYVVALDPAVVQIRPGTTDLMTSVGRMPTGFTLVLIAAYTPAGTPYERIIPLAATDEFSVRFNGQTALGSPIDFIAAYCTISGTGDTQLISASAPQTMQLVITPLQRVAALCPITTMSDVVDEWINS